jgi:Beta propeller domain
MRIGILLLGLALLAPLSSQATGALRPYRDEAEFTAALDRWRQAAQLEQRARREAAKLPSLAQASPAAPATALMEKAATNAADGAAAESSITNVQTAGVDEGGLVKHAGEHLVILRRGRLFTVRVGGDQLQPVAAVDAYAPGSDPRGAWYDELLVQGSTVVVIGYSYARGGTEIGLFELGRDGSLAYRATHHLKSHDYYSARNYASRLVGRQLVFYSPTLLQAWGLPWAQMMPAHRRWGGPAQPADFERILPATRIYRSDDEFDPAQPLALHTVTRCDLGGGTAAMRCESSAVLGPAGRVFYVSAGSVYVWTQGRREHESAGRSAVFRLPLDGAAPAALKTVGMPVDNFSFLEDGAGFLNVLLREHGPGEGMFGARRAQGRLALLRVPLAAFGDGSAVAQREHYQRMPGPERGELQNRFVGDWLLWGAGDTAWAARLTEPARSQALAPGHAIERIEALGDQALLAGSAGNELVFSAVRLPRQGRGSARIEDRLSHPGARQGETRSHGFFYRATGADEGLMGLPVLGSEGGRGSATASVVVVRNRNLNFSTLGSLSASTSGRVADQCKASCVDWYGNARPIFLGERVLALMGYELVEGRLVNGVFSESIEERRRVDYLQPRLRPQYSNRPTPFEE